MRKIAKDVYHMPLIFRNGINCYLIEDVLIDSGTRNSFNKIKSNLKGMPLNAHALTHGHTDHQGSSKLICDHYTIPLWCSAKEKGVVESGFATKEYPKQKHIITKLQQKYWAGKGHSVSKTLKEGDIVAGFTVIETPGNTSGHISYFREKDGVLILGDVLINMNLYTTIVGLAVPPSFFTFDLEENIKSLKKIVALKPTIICFGHGPVLTDMSKLESLMRNLKK
jgi:glyoxylase-like metal-dependent hydrolase (beta-lactamase superfamily II)